MSRGHRSPRSIVVFATCVVSTLLLLQLVAAAAWTADSANMGPPVVILQLADDPDTNWAVADLQEKLSRFIVDDPYLVNRIVVRRTDNPHIARDLTQSIVIYVSHGGPFGIVTGKRVTSWKSMADIVTESAASMHLFAACDSRNIIRYGHEDAEKKLYTVPGARPAEVTNIEIASTVMLAFGLDAEYVEAYRTSELTDAKKRIEAGMKAHIMDFEQIILSEIDNIDESYSDTYTSSYRVYRDSVTEELSGILGFSELPYDVRHLLSIYYSYYTDNSGVPYVIQLDNCLIDYTKNYYYEAWWVEDPEPPPPEPPPRPPPKPPPIDIDAVGIDFSSFYYKAAAATSGHWEYGSHIFTGGAYSGWVIYQGVPGVWTRIVVNVTASGPTLDADGKTEVDSISMNQMSAGGQYVQQEKVDGVWQEPVVGRNPYRTGGLWSDPANKADYEYDSSWAELPSMQSTMKENAEDGDTALWGVYDNSPAGYIYNVYDNDGRAIRLVGGGTGTGYRYPYSSANYWNDAEHKSIQWSMKYSESYVVYVSCDTTAGHRYIYYTNLNYNLLKTSTGYVHHGLGTWTTDGRWHTFTRNLQDDLHDGEPNVNIIDVNAILFRGSGRVDNIILLNTEYESYGEIHSNGEFITVQSIPSGNSWHGPSFVRTLPSYFMMNDFGSFSANLSLVHSGYANRLGTLAVSLFDENKKIVASIQIRDMWGSEEKVRFYAYYFFEDGSYRSDASPYFYGDTDGIVTLRYNPVIGLLANFPEDSESTLVPHHIMNPTRLIKYIAVQSYRYGYWAEHDERVYNVRLNYAGSEFTVFHDNCNDMDEFSRDISTPSGVLDVPTDQSYMTWTSIDSGSGWHGPQYVQHFDRPFRLYQLSEFSVLAELINGAPSEMGITRVTMLDDYGSKIMTIRWGDSGSSWTDGWVYIDFYPQNGGHYARNLWYGESSYLGTIKMWWEESTGQGSIHISRSGSPYSPVLNEVDNAARVVKSLVIEGQRYASNTLVDMRIHDINVVADLSQHAPDDPNPEEPIPLDGSGSIPDATVEENRVQNFFDVAFAYIVPYWTLENFWPWLHIATDEPPDTETSCDVHVSVDLLQTIRVHSLSAMTVPESTRTDEQIDQDARGFVDYMFEFITRFAVHAALAFMIGLAGRAIDMVSAVVVNPANLLILLVMLAAWVVLVASYFTWLDYMVSNGYMHPWSAAGSTLFLMLGLFTGPILTGLQRGWKIYQHFKKWYNIGGKGISGLWPKDWYTAAFAVVSIVVKIIILLACLNYFGRFYRLGVELESS
ncbi:MAG: hypothetical protein ACFFAX_01650 [Promethearchaeota archaeon]